MVMMVIGGGGGDVVMVVVRDVWCRCCWGDIQPVLSGGS